MAQENVGQIDLSDYLENKTTGVAQIVKLNGVPHYTTKGFDHKTGKPAPMLVPLDRASVEKQLGKLKNDAKIFTQLLDDIDAAPEKLA